MRPCAWQDRVEIELQPEADDPFRSVSARAGDEHEVCRADISDRVVELLDIGFHLIRRLGIGPDIQRTGGLRYSDIQTFPSGSVAICVPPASQSQPTQKHSWKRYTLGVKRRSDDKDKDVFRANGAGFNGSGRPDGLGFGAEIRDQLLCGRRPV